MSGFSKASEILDKIGLPKIAEGSEIEQKSQPAEASEIEKVEEQRPSTQAKHESFVKVPQRTAEVIISLATASGHRIYRELVPVEEEERKLYQDCRKAEAESVEIQALYKWERREGRASLACYMPEETIRAKPNWVLLGKSWLTSLAMAYEQGDSVIRFTLTDKLRRMGYTEERLKRGGKIYKEAMIAEEALVAILIRYDNHKSGAKNVKFLGHPYSYLEKLGRRYEVGLNPKLVEDINFSTGIVEAPYVLFPLPIPDENPDRRYEQKLRCKLLALQRLSELVFTGEILLEWAGVPKKKRRYRAIQRKIYAIAKRILESECGFKQKEVFRTAAEFRKFRTLKLHYTQTNGRRDFTPAEIALAKEITEWISKEGRDPEAEEPKIKRCIASYGLFKVEDCYRGASSASDFWRRIKQLKRARELEKQWLS